MRPASVTLGSLGGWPAVLGPLCARRDLTAEAAGAAMAEILRGDATPAQVAAFIVALRIKGESVEEMGALLATMLEFSDRVSLPPGIDADDVVDTCGTGGDRSFTINASTLAALVVAGTGSPVCKHGNRAASSTCGSADLLEALDVVIELGPEGVAGCMTSAGMGFCFAPRFHPALRHAGPTRRELGVPTVLNFLGPLANPAGARRQVLGVSDPAMAERLVGVLRAQGARRALVVYGHDGLDELTTTTTSTVMEVVDGEVRRFDVDPAALGMARATLGDLRGGDVATNLVATRRVLDGDKGPHRDLVVLNAAAGLVAAGRVGDLSEGVELAGDVIDDGRAQGVLDRLVAASQAGARREAQAAAQISPV
ncbi:MAG: anthranilate phosphoribosyltransferase [Acidimicrobiales bacterium]